MSNGSGPWIDPWETPLLTGTLSFCCLLPLINSETLPTIPKSSHLGEKSLVRDPVGRILQIKVEDRWRSWGGTNSLRIVRHDLIHLKSCRLFPKRLFVSGSALLRGGLPVEGWVELSTSCRIFLCYIESMIWIPCYWQLVLCIWRVFASCVWCGAIRGSYRLDVVRGYFVLVWKMCVSAGFSFLSQDHGFCFGVSALELQLQVLLLLEWLELLWCSITTTLILLATFFWLWVFGDICCYEWVSCRQHGLVWFWIFSFSSFHCCCFQGFHFLMGCPGSCTA